MLLPFLCRTESRVVVVTVEFCRECGMCMVHAMCVGCVFSERFDAKRAHVFIAFMGYPWTVEGSAGHRLLQYLLELDMAHYIYNYIYTYYIYLFGRVAPNF